MEEDVFNHFLEFQSKKGMYVYILGRKVVCLLVPFLDINIYFSSYNHFSRFSRITINNLPAEQLARVEHLQCSTGILISIR
jgi:hypothetical protein